MASFPRGRENFRLRLPGTSGMSLAGYQVPSCTSLGYLWTEAFYAHRMAFARRLRILVLLDAQFIREMWAHTFDQKALLNGNISYKHFGSG